MSLTDFLTLATLALAILLVTPFLGRYIHRVMEGERVFLSPILRPVERAVYRVCGIDETAEQDWKGYTVSVLAMAVVAIAVGYVMLRLQDVLPFNQGGIPPMTPDLAFNTSVSFETNTNWQNYSGETGATYLSQAAMLAVRNFTSAATGLAVAIALIRGLTRRSSKTLGNYWVDLTRGVLYILLPISIVGALVLVWQGVPQTWAPSQTVTTVEGAQQIIALGPIASQEWIKELGNNGGGFFNANSSHPFESPTPLTNWLEIFALLAISFSLTYTFGRYAGSQRQGWTIFGAMAAILLVGAVVAMHVEYEGNPALPRGRRPGRRRQHGGQGSPLRGRGRWPVHGRHDRHQHRRDQLLARQRPADRRSRPALQHGARRDHPGRHRRRHVRHARHRRDPRRLHRRAHGRPDAGVPRQEGRDLRDQDGDDHRPRARRQHPRLHRPRLDHGRGHGRPAEHRTARLQRDPVRLLQPDRQQRLGLRRPDRQHAVLQRHRRPRDAHRPLRDDRPDPRPGRLDGRQAARRAVPRHVPDDGRPVDRPAHRCRDHRRRADVLPGPGAGADRRAAPPERRKGPRDGTPLLGRPRARHAPLPALRDPRRRQAVGRAAAPARHPRSGPPPGRDPARLPQAGPAAPDQEPGHVRRRDHGGPGDAHLDRQRHRHADGVRAAPAAASSSRSRSGCGSRSCSRPTPRPSPRRAAGPRPRRSARPAPRRPRTAARPTGRSRTSARPSSARATSSSSRRARRSPATATSSRASASSTRPRSPASRRRSSRSPAPTSGARSPAARPSSATGSSSA